MNTRQLTAAMLASLAVFVAMPSQAHPVGDPAAHVARITEMLGLYDDQVPQVQAILEESQLKIKEIRSSHTLDQREEARAAMKAVRENTHKRLATVLTAEQMETLEAHHEKKRALYRDGHRKHGERTHN